MKNKIFSLLVVIVLITFLAILNISMPTASAEQIDVHYLQTCLKAEGSSLDVLVLMDSSKSLRDAVGNEKHGKGSDPQQKRGKILVSSLKILRNLAKESNRTFNINLKNFGENSNPKELQVLQSHWHDWSAATTDNDLKKFVEDALYQESEYTEWANGLASAKQAFQQKIGQAKLNGTSSCPIMFWITDGAPTSHLSGTGTEIGRAHV